jgi:hypothetical protein
VPAVLGGVVRPAVADAVALGGGPVHRTKSGSCSRSVFEQARGWFGEQAGPAGDVRVDGTDGYRQPGHDPGEGVVAARVHLSDKRTLVRRELAAAAPSRVTMSMVTQSTRAWGRSSAAGWGTNRAPVPVG